MKTRSAGRHIKPRNDNMPALFLDRDGVLIENRSNYVRVWSDVAFFPFTFDAMRAAAAAEDFERASVLRDDLAALQRVQEKSAVVLPDGTNADVIAVAFDELQAAVQVFSVRTGRIVGHRDWPSIAPMSNCSRGPAMPAGQEWRWHWPARVRALAFSMRMSMATPFHG